MSEHIWEPEWPNEAPRLSDESDEYTHRGRFLAVAVHSVCDQHGCYDLVSSCCNRGANVGSNVPLALWRFLDADEKDNQANDGDDVAGITQPQTVFVLWSGAFLRASVHPPVGKGATKLLTDDRTDHNGDELQTEFLRVEHELGSVELGNLNGGQHRGEEEYHGVSDGRNEDARMPKHQERLNEIVEAKWCRIDAAKGQILPLEIGAMMLNTAANVARLGSKEEIENELHGVDLIDRSI